MGTHFGRKLGHAVSFICQDRHSRANETRMICVSCSLQVGRTLLWWKRKEQQVSLMGAVGSMLIVARNCSCPVMHWDQPNAWICCELVTTKLQWHLLLFQHGTSREWIVALPGEYQCCLCQSTQVCNSQNDSAHVEEQRWWKLLAGQVLSCSWLTAGSPCQACECRTSQSPIFSGKHGCMCHETAEIKYVARKAQMQTRGKAQHMPDCLGHWHATTLGIEPGSSMRTSQGVCKTTTFKWKLVHLSWLKNTIESSFYINIIQISPPLCHLTDSANTQKCPNHSRCADYKCTGIFNVKIALTPPEDWEQTVELWKEVPLSVITHVSFVLFDAWIGPVVCACCLIVRCFCSRRPCFTIFSCVKSC